MYSVYCQECENQFFADEDWKTICKTCYWKKKRREEGKTNWTASTPKSAAADMFPDGMINSMIRLCHPDKHENSQASNDVTKWLLSKRKEFSGK